MNNNSQVFSSILFHLFIFTTFATMASLSRSYKCSEKQSQALLLFKQNHSSTDFTYNECQNRLGSYYHPIMMTWNTSTDCCNWNGVTCDYSTGDVIGIDLSCGMLSGAIHPNSSLFDLPRLQTLNLAFNDFYPSQIPSEIGRFSNSLTHLNLSYCSFSGQVPPDITRLRKLVSLDLSMNDNDLKLEPHVFINLIRNVTNLEKLSLAYVNISSVLPTRLDISSPLKLLNLKWTCLQGKLPRDIFSIRSLETLDLSYNSFTGDIPSDISVNIARLAFLDLSQNQLNGTLPSWIFISPSLEYLYLSDNMFSGNVPFEAFALPSLKILDLSYGQLSGHIDMQTFQQLANLTELDLSFNNFSGECELDTLLTSFKNLEVLDLSYSGFSVTTKNLNHDVNPRFRVLSLAFCKLRVFPDSFRAMKQLERLDLSNNEIHGQIPYWAGEIGGNELHILDLSHNFVRGLPQFQWYGLQQLNLQSNMIQGPFPPSICNMSNLVYLDMSNNRFGGSIPQCFGNISSFIETVDMGNNGFHGTIPNTYENCGGLQGLSLNGNELQGNVPSSLYNCQSLKVIDFGNNQLNGTFPSWLGDLPYLEALVFKSNNFHGNIQLSSTVEYPFSSLRVLDLSQNGFVGQLPTKLFQNFNSVKNVVANNTKPVYLDMGDGKYYSFVVSVKGVNQNFQQISVDYTIIDLSNNKFEGQIPNVIGDLSALIVLNLSHNSLTGQIPHALGNLIEIESLDLSWNQLSGEIPQSLARINTLEVLNLSHNRLVGHIPDGTQFNTFEEKSFEGNPGLCGLPLTRKCGEHTQKQELESHEEESGFTWKVVTLGYGCGTLLGLVMGYLMLSTRKVKWFNAIADATQCLVLMKMNKKRRHIYIGK